MQQNNLWSESEGDHITSGPEVTVQLCRSRQSRHFTELCFYLSTAKLSSIEELNASISHGHNSTDFSITQKFR
jgi:hypothetical protein